MLYSIHIIILEIVFETDAFLGKHANLTQD